MASTMLINAWITNKIRKRRKISRKKNSILFNLTWNKILTVKRARSKARENWKRIVRYRVDDPYSFRSNFTHRRSRKSWHWLWDRLQTESHAFRVVALIFAGRCQNLFGLHGGQVRRSGPRLKRNSHVIVAYQKASNLTQTWGICELSRSMVRRIRNYQRQWRGENLFSLIVEKNWLRTSGEYFFIIFVKFSIIEVKSLIQFS